MSIKENDTDAFKNNQECISNSQDSVSKPTKSIDTILNDSKDTTPNDSKDTVNILNDLIGFVSTRDHDSPEVFRENSEKIDVIMRNLGIGVGVELELESESESKSD